MLERERPLPSGFLTRHGPRWRVLVTAEHGGHRVPGRYRALFEGHDSLLRSHRGWDPGSLHLARSLARAVDGFIVASTVTRLLVDLNRSPHHPRVFSEITRALPAEERRTLLHRYHAPHRAATQAWVAAVISDGGAVLHLGVHSFTPVLEGRVRRPDVALLYDPRRELERAVASAWVGRMKHDEPGRVFGRNNPYRGSADGLTTTLRGLFPGDRYLGIEIEVNQRHLADAGRFPPWVSKALLAGLPGAPLL